MIDDKYFSNAMNSLQFLEEKKYTSALLREAYAKMKNIKEYNVSL